ncbi:MAG: hypothetical protein ACNYWU_02255 [Desulfobacterales bacterium]
MLLPTKALGTFGDILDKLKEKLGKRGEGGAEDRLAAALVAA